jgi:hypothetical protein
MSEGDELRICEPATPLEAGPHHFGYSPTSPKSPADCGFEDGLLVDSSRTSPRGEDVAETEPVALKRTSSVTLTENRRVHLFDKRAPAMHHLSLVRPPFSAAVPLVTLCTMSTLGRSNNHAG